MSSSYRQSVCSDHRKCQRKRQQQHGPMRRTARKKSGTENVRRPRELLLPHLEYAWNNTYDAADDLQLRQTDLRD